MHPKEFHFGSRTPPRHHPTTPTDNANRPDCYRPTRRRRPGGLLRSRQQNRPPSSRSSIRSTGHTPTIAQRHGWVAAFGHYDPDRAAHWGNQARTDHGWAAAVNEFATNPANQHPSRSHDIGVVRGVTLTARITATAMLIAPRVAGDTQL